MTDPFYLLVCRVCQEESGEPTIMPFETQEARGKWAGAHTRGTGHDQWWCATQSADGTIR